MFEVGRICLKLAGREAGKYCVIVKKMDESFVMVTGPKSLTRVKRRRCNINHLEPIEEKVKIKAEATDAEVLKAYQEASLLSKLGFEKPKGVKKVEPKREPKPEAKPVEKKEKPKEVKKEEKAKEKKMDKPPKPPKPAKGKKNVKAKPKSEKKKAKPKTEKSKGKKTKKK